MARTVANEPSRMNSRRFVPLCISMPPFNDHAHHNAAGPPLTRSRIPCKNGGMMRRREFLAAACAVPFLPALQARPIRLGGPIFLKSDDPGELAREHRRWGYSAAYCPAVRVDD